MPIGWGLEVDMGWTKPESSGDVPPPRSGHTFTITSSSHVEAEDESGPRKAVLFGGNDSRLPAGPTNDLFEMDLDSFEWKKTENTGSQPTPRAKHTTTCVQPNVLCVFGGLGEKSRLNDCW